MTTQTQRKWINQKFTLKLSRKELFELSYIIASLDRTDRDFLEIKDKNIRSSFERQFKKRHKFWLRIQRLIR